MAVVQAISTVVLVVATGAYVWLTDRLVKRSAPTPWLEPVDIICELDHMTVTIKNHGPGHAIRVKVAMNDNQQTAPIADGGKVEIDPSQKTYAGHPTIFDGASRGYTRVSRKHAVLLAAKSQIRLEWESVTGTKLRHEWTWNVDEEKWSLA